MLFQSSGRFNVLSFTAVVSVMAGLLLGSCLSSSREVTGSVAVSSLSGRDIRFEFWCRDVSPDMCGEDSALNTDGGSLDDADEAAIFAAFLDYIIGTDCSDGFGSGFLDVHTGAEVLVLDGAGGVVGKANLGPGVFVESEEAARIACLFEFSGELSKADFYTFEIAGRDGPTWTADELRSDGRHVELELVDNF